MQTAIKPVLLDLAVPIITRRLLIRTPQPRYGTTLNAVGGNMIRNIIWLFITLITALVSLSAQASNTKIVMSYWPSPNPSTKLIYPVPGSLNEHGNTVANQDMQAKLDYLDILAYAFFNVNKDGVIHVNNSRIDLSESDNTFCTKYRNICTDQYGKYAPKLGNFSAFVKLQNQSGTLKKLISIGGAGSNTTFNNAITHIPAFVNSVALLIHYYHLDGVDLDFEPNIFTSQQSHGYANLITALRKKLGSSALITLAIAPDQQIKRPYWKTIADNINYISDMCYEFHSPFYQPYYTGHASNLYTDLNEPMLINYYHMSCDQSIKYLTFLGMPSEKILLGYPSYAKAYGGVESQNHGLFQKFDPNQTPELDKSITKGSVRYIVILKLLTKRFSEYAIYKNDHMSAAWAYNPTTKQFLTYDNVTLIKEKAHYVKKNNLAGLMTWAINYDVPVTNQQSLLRAAKQCLNN